MRTLTQSPRLRFEVVSGIDHELYGYESRRLVSARITDYVVTRYAAAMATASARPE